MNVKINVRAVRFNFGGKSCLVIGHSQMGQEAPTRWPNKGLGMTPRTEKDTKLSLSTYSFAEEVLLFEFKLVDFMC